MAGPSTGGVGGLGDGTGLSTYVGPPAAHQTATHSYNGSHSG